MENSIFIGAAVSAANSVGWFIPMLVAAVAYFQYEELMSPESRPIDIPSENLYDKYDFIIVGAGSAGEANECNLKTCMNKVGFI